MSRTIALVSLLLLVAGSRSARARASAAQAPTAQTSNTQAPVAQSPSAQADFDRGLRSYATGQYADAIAAFRAGYELDPRPEFLYALAQAERKSGDCAHAVDTYRAYLRTHPSATAEAPARENLKRCEETLAAAPPKPIVAQPLPPPPPSNEPRVPRPSWARDPAGASLTAIGLGLVGTGGALWGVGEAAVVSANQAARYDDFLAGQVDGQRGEQERLAGIVTLAVGGAALVAGLARWVWVARHR